MEVKLPVPKYLSIRSPSLALGAVSGLTTFSLKERWVFDLRSEIHLIQVRLIVLFLQISGIVT